MLEAFIELDRVELDIEYFSLIFSHLALPSLPNRQCSCTFTMSMETPSIRVNSPLENPLNNNASDNDNNTNIEKNDNLKLPAVLNMFSLPSL